MTLVIDLFVEDVAHERFLGALVKHPDIAPDVDCRIRPRLARGGHASVLKELRLYQRLPQPDPPDVLLIGRDANALGWAAARAEVVREIDPSRVTVPVVIACPEPYIERWYLADPPSLEQALGLRIPSLRATGERGQYKKILVDALRAADYPVTLGGVEFADDIVDCMDLYRAGRENASLKDFIEQLRTTLRRLVAP